jgi:hypothetical protein
MNYTVQRVERGILIKGTIAVTDLTALSKAWKKQGLDTLMPGIASALGYSFAICNEKDSAAWEKEISEKVTAEAGDDKGLAWLNGTDTGTSSLTIFSVLSANHGRYALQGHRRADAPSDPADFGRCFRLLQIFPEWEGRLSEVAAKHPIWVGFARDWQRLKELYLEELPKDRCPKLYAAMQILYDEGRIADGWVKTGFASWTKKR